MNIQINCMTEHKLLGFVCFIFLLFCFFIFENNTRIKNIMYCVVNNFKIIVTLLLVKVVSDVYHLCVPLMVNIGISELSYLMRNYTLNPETFA